MLPNGQLFRPSWVKGIWLKETFEIQVFCISTFRFFSKLQLDQDENDKCYTRLQMCFPGLIKLESCIQFRE